VSPDVVVCGAGVGGLAAARALRAAGLEVLVLDRQRDTPATSRAAPGASSVFPTRTSCALCGAASTRPSKSAAASSSKACCAITPAGSAASR
jgi:cation diffusion facilitator CzcD-associated flavoprotein CzcO